MWRVYRAKLQAHLLNGTYFFEESRFFGTLTGPVIDMHGPEPGPGWELLTSPPAVLEPGVALCILRGGDVAGPLLERYGETKLGELA
jgi:hypothetical protein